MSDPQVLPDIWTRAIESQAKVAPPNTAAVPSDYATLAPDQQQAVRKWVFDTHPEFQSGPSAINPNSTNPLPDPNGANKSLYDSFFQQNKPTQTAVPQNETSLPPEWTRTQDTQQREIARTFQLAEPAVQSFLQNSTNPQQDMNHAVVAAFLSHKMGVDMSYALQNTEGLASAYWGKTTTIPSAVEAITNSWKASDSYQRIADLRFQQLMGSSDPGIDKQVDLIRSAIPPDDQIMRSFPVEVLKASANLGPYMWDNFKANAPMVAVAGVAGLAAGGPAVGLSMAMKAMQLGSVAYTFKTEAGLQLDQLIQMGVDPKSANAIVNSLLVGGINAALEQVSLANIPGAAQLVSKLEGMAGKQVGEKLIFSGLFSKTAAKLAAGGGVIRKAGVEMLRAQIIEPTTEVAQQLVNDIGSNIAVAVQNAAEGTNLPQMTVDQIKNDVVQTYKTTAMAMLAIGAPGSVLSGIRGERATQQAVKAQTTTQTAPPVTTTVPEVTAATVEEAQKAVQQAQADFVKNPTENYLGLVAAMDKQAQLEKQQSTQTASHRNGY